MKIDQVELRRIQMPLKAPFATSFGTITTRDCVLVKVFSDGLCGYAESVAFSLPFYSEETPDTVWHILENFLIPRIWGRSLDNLRADISWYVWIRRNYMAISALESALWDLYCKKQNISLAQALGGTRNEIAVGVSIGIETEISCVLDQIEQYLCEGYKKIKVKIKPGFDLQLLEAIRNRFGDTVPLMADANSAYTLKDIPLFREFDAFNLLMIEQPLAHNDLIDHSKLQQELQTPICLDESICSLEDMQKAIDLKSCRIINIKIGRVGGLASAKGIHDLCHENGIPVWCGGMLELGVGRAHNIALASLPNFSIAGDTSASKRSFTEDIVEPAVDFCRPGFLAVPKGQGIGYEIRHDVIKKFTVYKKTFVPTA